MRKKIILASAVSCLLVSPVHANTDKPEGWYLKGSYEKLFKVKKFNNLSAVGASLGYKKDFLRGEASFGYARVEESLCWNSACFLRSKGNNFNYGLHGFLDWDNTTIISPYIGLGIEKNTYKSPFADYRTDKVMGVGLVGARAYLTKNVALDVGYKADLSRLNKGGAASVGLAWHFD